MIFLEIKKELKMYKAQIGHDNSIKNHNQVEFTLTPAKCTSEFRLLVMSKNAPLYRQDIPDKQ